MAKNMVIIGGGAGGASAGAAAKRGDQSLRVTMIEQSPYVSTAA